MAEKPSYRPFIVTDPAPYMDQFIRTAGVMSRKCGGTSTEFVVNSIIQACKNPECMVLAVCPEAAPDRLAGWLGCTFVRDTYQPWVEIWALWITPGKGRQIRDQCIQIIVDWARWKGAVRITAIITRNKKGYLRSFLEDVKFVPVGIVIERRV